ncbi:TlpA family protein disulfide reductase [Chitinophaga sancti]|uniref:TlpA family protein disulfide reductase n=1 Tax=Chitinophaga sancti TaxID=1004 RepID=UPI003F794AC0
MNKQNILRFLKKNLNTMIWGLLIIVLVTNTSAKAWVLRRMMDLGIFNAHIKPGPSHEIVSFNYRDVATGNVVNTSSLRGKVVFINYWASWCPPCRAEFSSVMSLYNRFKDNPQVVFILINEDDDLAKAKEFLQKENCNLPIYKALDIVPVSVYNGTLPTTVILDKEGKIKYHHEGLADYGREEFANQINEVIRSFE